MSPFLWLAFVGLAFAAVRHHYRVRIAEQKRIQGFWTRNGEEL